MPASVRGSQRHHRRPESTGGRPRGRRAARDQVAARFLRDTNETTRFHAASTLLAQPEAAEHKAALVACLVAEDSVRVRNRILESFASLGWDVGPNGDAVRSRLPAGYRLDARGIPHRG